MIRGRARLTTTMFTTPMIVVRIPEQMTICQKDKPSDCWLVASLFKLPRIETPTTIMKIPRVTKPDFKLRRGQFLEW